MVDRPDPEQPKPRLHIQVIDRPEIDETFIDSIGAVIFEGQALRIEGCVTRFASSEPAGPLTAHRYTSCRLVLAPGAAVELMNQLQTIANQLVKAGVLKQTEPIKAAQGEIKAKN